jgi:hypothetical protein
MRESFRGTVYGNDRGNDRGKQYFFNLIGENCDEHMHAHRTLRNASISLTLLC